MSADEIGREAPEMVGTYISDLIFKGIRVKDDRAATLHLERVQRAKRRIEAKKSAALSDSRTGADQAGERT